ncbi:hypothetical protein COY89_00145 [Candidatus Roizmanbacteria bacterium CG_4_10_14_0_8_um_filter_36_36]|uniref:Uncharacterized protein n=2 Tax=Candidatus Roizmaniibacteriota TaxID=1752723 RepID=A0A2M7U6D5_9BACT|nr:MAG: hypothetical protein COV86_00465 [Candidatus Roizmanbacteria bacterium CG11_big_fil_rev_8_21_14_0_20_35_14]PIY70634.1 MAG: hypothetical protein COY89_00145 [Candidatus Roizmanbacteria bacterium CG_4_10_14_0_8_um_filter_36_36]PIZ66770.1 MAG: hypothetical protein COY13_04855 [Candidatus Roizmanbacteria bacterium CG_4_10_14_0_2_um_filter_36_35]
MEFCYILIELKKTEGIFNALVGQILSGLSSPARVFKFCSLKIFALFLCTKKFRRIFQCVRADFFGGAALRLRSV